MAKSHQFEGCDITKVCPTSPQRTLSLADQCKRGPGGATRQAAALRREGVTVRNGALGELTIDLGTYGWFPSILPSEEAEYSESEGEDDA